MLRALSIAALVLLMENAVALQIHVSPHGDDAASGTRARPLKTFAAAQRVARERRNGEPVVVEFASGVYYLDAPIVFTAEDSGTPTAPVTFKAENGAKVVISGGIPLHADWKPCRDGIWQTSVPAGWSTDQLFIDGRLQVLARYPNYDPKVDIFNGYAADAIDPGRVSRWAHPEGGFIHAMHAFMWGGFHYRITGKNADGTLAYEGGKQNNRPTGMHPEYRFVEGIFEELDAPGEWFLDQAKHTLYYYPTPGLDLANAEVVGVRLRSLVEMRGSSKNPVGNIRLEGLTFRQAARTFMDTTEPLLRSDWTIYRGGAVFLQGTENCALKRCHLDGLGGNAIFVSGYNRRFAVRSCRIDEIGASGVCFVGDPKAVRNPIFDLDRQNSLSTIDPTPGPKTPDYPASCLVEDCLICRTGRVEKQTAPIQIAMSEGITVSHCSLYDVPRAGINIGDGCWGGDVIEYCDVFDTVKETGDHGSFNSWGRDRYWNLAGSDPNHIDPRLPFLDAVKPTVLRNNRWRCDHGWDVDLDDGSSNYIIENNLCLHGGLKNREGFGRRCTNNVVVGNSFHPHVWFVDSRDVFERNIVFTPYRPIDVPKPWGKECDFNLLHIAGLPAPKPAKVLQDQSGRDEHSIEADALFMDPAKGDYRVRRGSPALMLGFRNFRMDEFGVRDPELRKIARTPELP